MRAFRADIQALRGLAVLLVVVYHAKLGLFPSGFLGVDIFFVISGFLITGLIRDGLEAGRFRASEFYFRRAKRLLPAAYTTFALTALLAPVFLAGYELKELVPQLYGAVTFTANIVLWRQSGYFAGAAELKPLLHVWSLSLEEQYYFLLPVLLMVVPRRFWMPLVLIMFGGSLALRVAASGHPDAAFYLFPTRAWELMLGSIGALLPPALRTFGPTLRLTFWPSALILIAVPASAMGRALPVTAMTAVCLATLCVILCRRDELFKAPAMRPLTKVGDMSYSLYLVHWPLFAFFANTWISGTERTAALWHLGLVAASLILAWLLHRFVEMPTHYRPVKNRVAFTGVLVTASLLLAVLTTGLGRYATARADLAGVTRSPNYGFNAACDFTTDFRPIAACRNSNAPRYLVWGDSYAMALVPGLLGSANPAPAVVQATRSVCGPMQGVALVNAGRYDRDWAESCIRFGDSVLDYAKRTASIRTVILTSPFYQYVRDSLLVRNDDGHLAIKRFDPKAAAERLSETIAALRRSGKNVIVFSPPPQATFDAPRCIERIAEGLPVIAKLPGCTIDAQEYRSANADILGFLARAEATSHAVFVDLAAMLCDAKTCKTKAGNIGLYRDAGHLSPDGARYVFGHLPHDARQALSD